MLYFQIIVNCVALVEESDSFCLTLRHAVEQLRSIYKGKYYLFPLYSVGEALTLAACCEHDLCKILGMYSLVEAFFEECDTSCEVLSISQMNATSFHCFIHGRNDPPWNHCMQTITAIGYEFHEALDKAVNEEKLIVNTTPSLKTKGLHAEVVFFHRKMKRMRLWQNGL